MNFKEFYDSILGLKPDLAAALKGASDSEINELEKLWGRPLPEDYRTFLSLMGKDTGPLRVLRDTSPDLNPTIKGVLSAHRKAARETKNGKAPWYFFEVKEDKQMLLFAMDSKGNDNGNYFMDLRDPRLPVVELTESLGKLDRYPTLWAAMFSEMFPAQVRRALAKD